MSTAKLRDALRMLDEAQEHPNRGEDDKAVLRAAREELAALEKAAHTLYESSVSDFTYHVRARAAEDSAFSGNTWLHPKVVAFSDACEVIAAIARQGESK